MIIMMNILKPIDYIIYKISRIYQTGIDKYCPEVWARANLAALILFNIGNIRIWTRSAFLVKAFLPLCLGIFVFLFFYYNESRFKKIEERYRNEPPKQKLWGSIAVITYVVVSIVLFFGPLIIKAQFP